MTVPITVVIPVGPAPHHTAHLAECLDSVRGQTEPPAEVQKAVERGITAFDRQYTRNVLDLGIIPFPDSQFSNLMKFAITA